MKRSLITVFTFVLGLCLFFPYTGKAAANPTYFTVEANKTTVPGIYKSTPNGKSSLVLKGAIFKPKTITSPLIKLTDTNFFQTNGKAGNKEDENIISKPIQDVQTSGKDIYYTKFLMSAMYAGGCGGGGGDILEVYKKSASGKVTKVTSDKVSSHTEQSIKVANSSLYYPKVEDQVMGNFSIVRLALNGKSKKTLIKKVDDFWIQQNKIYVIKDEALYKMNLDGSSLKKQTDMKAKLYDASGCDEGNYMVSKNGVTAANWDKSNEIVYYQFSTGTTSKLSGGNGIIDVNLKTKKYLAYSYDDDENSAISLFDFKGKLIKKVKVFNWDNGFKLISADAIKGELLYSEGSKLKLMKF